MLFVYTTSTVTFSLSSSCTVYTPRPLLLDRTLLARRDTHPHPCRLVRDRGVLLIELRPHQNLFAAATRRYS
jgi:hypothetical protein